VNSKEVERRFREATWPEPSRDLRARVIAQAAVRPQSISWSDRVWFSPGWRLSMAALVIAVFVIRAWAGPHAVGLPDPSPRALADANAIEETGRDIGLPESVVASFARRAMSQTSRPPAMTFSAPELLFLDQEETRRE
jgi:hypothetical protein